MTSEIENLQTTNIETTATTVDELHAGDELHASQEHHEGPHIPTIQGEQVWGPISNTVVTTLVFTLIVIVFSVLAKKAILSDKKSRLKLVVLSFVKYFDEFLRDGFGDKKMAREFFPLIAGFFFIIF